MSYRQRQPSSQGDSWSDLLLPGAANAGLSRTDPVNCSNRSSLTYPSPSSPTNTCSSLSVPFSFYPVPSDRDLPSPSPSGDSPVSNFNTNPDPEGLTSMTFQTVGHLPSFNTPPGGNLHASLQPRQIDLGQTNVDISPDWAQSEVGRWELLDDDPGHDHWSNVKVNLGPTISTVVSLPANADEGAASTGSNSSTGVGIVPENDPSSTGVQESIEADSSLSIIILDRIDGGVPTILPQPADETANIENEPSRSQSPKIFLIEETRARLADRLTWSEGAEPAIRDVEVGHRPGTPIIHGVAQTLLHRHENLESRRGPRYHTPVRPVSITAPPTARGQTPEGFRMWHGPTRGTLDGSSNGRALPRTQGPGSVHHVPSPRHERTQITPASGSYFPRHVEMWFPAWMRSPEPEESVQDTWERRPIRHLDHHNPPLGDVTSVSRSIRETVDMAQRSIRALRSGEDHAAENNLIRTIILYQEGISAISRLLPLVDCDLNLPRAHLLNPTPGMGEAAMTRGQEHTNSLRGALAFPEEVFDSSADLHRESVQTIDALINAVDSMWGFPYWPTFVHRFPENTTQRPPPWSPMGICVGDELGYGRDNHCQATWYLTEWRCRYCRRTMRI